MAWTSPKTISPGAAALASDWNTYIRDNSQYLKDEADVASSNISTIQSDVSQLQTDVTALQNRIQIMTQAEYDGITPDPETIYFIVG